MKCITCEEDRPRIPYKCPQCRSLYCSVKCFKVHKLNCSQTEVDSSQDTSRRTEIFDSPNSALISAPIAATHANGDDLRTSIADQPDKNPVFEAIWANSRIQELCSYESTRKLLKLIVEISHNPRLSGEQDAEGRKLVALKKIRELRKGGSEANISIEEMVTTVNHLWKSETSGA